ncbi:MAG TPA: FAD-dependent oxidoreductase [Chthoniobacterales bacterium]|nr:FAD-dependent oxidoreductase [Chthoniobacterales bacterium]
MAKSIAIIGAGVSGLTCGVLFAERRFSVRIFADQVGTETTSGAAGALWFPYDAEPADKVIPWALATYKVLVDLAGGRQEAPTNLVCLKHSRLETGVSMIELRQYSRSGEIEIPNWARSLSSFVILPAHRSHGEGGSRKEGSLDISVFESGFSLCVPLMDTTIYLDYLVDRFQKAGGEIRSGLRFEKLEDVEGDLVVNCAGIGARELARDSDLEPHRGQVAIVHRPDNLDCAIVCDDAPLMYVIPRTNDCVFGGTNEVSDNWNPDPQTTKAIVAECSRVLDIESPRLVRERVGLRPFRKSGVRLEKETLRDGRLVIHNYGHGGSGFTLSWGCAENVFELASE